MLFVDIILSVNILLLTNHVFLGPFNVSVNLKVEGKRPRGRSPKRWSDQISEQTKGPISAALRLATDGGKQLTS